MLQAAFFWLCAERSWLLSLSRLTFSEILYYWLPQHIIMQRRQIFNLPNYLLCSFLSFFSLISSLPPLAQLRKLSSFPCLSKICLSIHQTLLWLRHCSLLPPSPSPAVGLPPPYRHHAAVFSCTHLLIKTFDKYWPLECSGFLDTAAWCLEEALARLGPWSFTEDLISQMGASC